MAAKIVIALFALFAFASAGLAPAAFVAPYATSYNAHAVNHAIAAPVAAPLVAAPAVAAPFVAAPAVAAPLAYKAPIVSAYPYAYSYPSPLVLGK